MINEKIMFPIIMDIRSIGENAIVPQMLIFIHGKFIFLDERKPIVGSKITFIPENPKLKYNIEIESNSKGGFTK